MTSDESLNTGAPPEAAAAGILGRWVAALAEDAIGVAEVSQQFPPGAALRAPLRAGLRHLLHIERLSRGIEGLAMLEVAIMLRVTALLASPAEELDSETVLRLRADTPLIEELFPDEKDVIWRFCQTLIEAERGLPSEQPALGVAHLADDSELDMPPQMNDRGDISAPSGTFAAEFVGEAESVAAGAALAGDGAPSADSTSDAVGNDGQTLDAGPPAVAVEPPPSSEPALAPTEATAAPVVGDELVERLRLWAANYRAPSFGTKPHDLTRACAFVRTRVSAWAGL